MQSFTGNKHDRLQGGRCKSALDTPACSRCWTKHSRLASIEVLRVLCRFGFPDRWAIARSTSTGAHDVTPSTQAAQSIQADSCAIDRVQLHNQAKSLQDAGRTDQALELLMYGLQHLPTDRHFLSLASTLLLKSDQLDTATQMLQTARAHHPKHIPFFVTSAMLAARKGNHAEAVKILQAALAKQPANAALRQALGEVYHTMGQLDVARAHFSAAISLTTRMPHTYAAWAKAEASTGNIQKARKVYQEGALAVKDNTPLLHAWAKLELSDGNAAEATRLLNKALAANPQHVPSYMLLGQALWNEGKQAAARAVWHKGNNTSSGPSVALMCYWAQREMRIHNWSGARDLLRGVLATSPNNTRALSLLASLEDRAGNIKTAQRLYASALNPPSHNAPTHALYSHHNQTNNGTHTSTPGQQQQQQQMVQVVSQQQYECIPNQGDAVQAQPQTEGALHYSTLTTPGSHLEDVTNGSQEFEFQDCQLSQSPIPVLHSMCHHLLKMGAKQQCSTVLEHMLHREPRNGFVCHMAGLLAQKEGRWTDAMAWFKQGCRTQGRDGSLLSWEGLAELYAFLGQPDKARTVWHSGASYAATQIYSNNWGGPCGLVVPSPLPLDTPSTPAATPIDDSVLPQSDRASDISRRQPFTKSCTTQHDPTTNVNLHDATHPSHSSHLSSPPASNNTHEELVHSTEGHNTHNSTTSAPAWMSDWAEDDSSLRSSALQPPQPDLRDGVTRFPGVTSRYLRQWGLFEKKNGDATTAARLFELSSLENPQDVRTWLVWGMFERKRDTALAEQLFKRGLAVAPRNSLLWFSYADMLWRQKGNVNTARDVLRRATQLCARSIPLWLEWALLEWKAAGDPEAALELLNKGAAMPGGDKHGPLQEALAELHWELGDRERKWGHVRRSRDESQQAEEASMVSI